MKIEDIDWGSLEHAYGSAADVPDMLRGLRADDPKVRFNARDGIHAALDHQGVQRFESTFRAIPFLIEALSDPSTPERGEIARLLAELAVGDTCWFLHDGVHRDLQMNVDDAARAQHCSQITAKDFASRGVPRLPDNRLDLAEGSGLRWIYDAVAAGAPAYVAALDGADEDLRVAIPFLCAFLTNDEAVALTAPALERLLDDPSERVRASAALGLSHATKFVPERWAHTFTVLASRWARDLGPLERRTLALALVRFEQPARTAPMRAYVHAELRAGVSKVIPGPTFPWFRTDSPPFLFCTTWIGTAADERDELLAPGLAALATVEDRHDAADLAVWIAKLWVPAPGVADATVDGSDDLVVQWSRADVGAELHAVLTGLVASPAAWHFTDLGNELRDRGLPSARDALAAWLAAS